MTPKPVAENLWILQYPLRILGVPIGRTVTIMRLQNSGKLLIHSAAPFSPEDVAAIKELGESGWLLDVTNIHDTHAKEGHAAFPGIPYLAPEGFSEAAGVSTQPLSTPPAEWGEEVQVREFAGKAEMAREYAVLHQPSRTVIVADLAFHVTEDAPAGLRLYASVLLKGGGSHDTAMPAPQKWAARDKEAFERSLEQMMAWDFERVITGHGDVPVTNKAALTEALQVAGFLGGK